MIDFLPIWSKMVSNNYNTKGFLIYLAKWVNKLKANLGHNF